MRRRPRTIAGLVLRLLALRPWLAAGVAVGVAAPLALLAGASSTPPADVVTFNIQRYPKSPEQEAGAFELLGDLDAPIVAVQEISDPERFREEARRRLGPDWHFLPDSSDAPHHVGLLFDRSRYTWELADTHRSTMLYPGARPVLEVRLLSREERPRAIRVFVVHLRAGSAESSVETRKAQLEALARILSRPTRADHRRIVLGDFNSTSGADREAIARLADEVGLEWASSGLECTMFWARRDGCTGSALDHVLTSRPAVDVRAAGPCETEGCGPKDRCPAFADEVSDHCPVVVDL